MEARSNSAAPLFEASYELEGCAQLSRPPSPAWKLNLRAEDDYNKAALARDAASIRDLYGVHVLLDSLIADDRSAPEDDRDHAVRRFTDYCSQASSANATDSLATLCPKYLTLMATSPETVWRGLPGAAQPQTPAPGCRSDVLLLPEDVFSGGSSTPAAAPSGDDDAQSPDPNEWATRARRLYALSTEFTRCANAKPKMMAAYLIRERAVVSYDVADSNEHFLNNRNDAEEAFTIEARLANDAAAPAGVRADHKTAFVSRCIGTQRYLPEVENARCVENLAKMNSDPDAVLHVLVDSPYEFGLP